MGRMRFLKRVSAFVDTSYPHFLIGYVPLVFFFSAKPAHGNVFGHRPVPSSCATKCAVFEGKKGYALFFYDCDGHPSTLSARDLKLCSRPTVSGRYLWG